MITHLYPAKPFAPITLNPASDMSISGVHVWNTPCDPGETSGSPVGALVDGGSGSFTYNWSHTPDGASNFTVTASGGTTSSYYVRDSVTRNCPYQGGAFGTLSVTVTDTVTSQQAVFGGDYMLEYTG